MAIYDLPGKTILSHNRLGVRIELNFNNEGLLELWVSPRAETSNASRDRNWSNRDDHVRLFDAIGLRELSQAQFVRCDYDPFHIVVVFQNQTLHLVSLFDEPGVTLWFEQAQIVDFKSDKADTPLLREPQFFAVSHPDRDETLHFAAALNRGQFTHQLVVQKGRSTYATAHIEAYASLTILGGVAEDRVLERARNVAQVGCIELLERNERQVENALQSGHIELRDDAKLQKLVEVNRRVLLSQQDAQGAIRAALNRIYYLIWVRDGAIIECFKAHAGWSEGVEKWSRFLLDNPLEIDDEEPRGRTFGMLVNPITKWEEDGVFYAIWSAFTSWTQNDTAFSHDDLAVLRDAMDWLERYCFDAERGLFGRFYRCEEPFAGSRDSGFDNAVGKPTRAGEVMYDGHAIRRSYDIYINSICYASYVMLATLHNAQSPDAQLSDAQSPDNEYSNSCEDKARGLARHMEPWFENSPPDYGDLLTLDGEIVRASAFGLDRCDYVWALTVPPFASQPHRLPSIHRALLKQASDAPKGYFLAAYFSLLSAFDSDLHDENITRDAIQYAATQCYRAGDFLAMPDTVVELLDTIDGDLYHDVRPQAFSVGPLLATLCGLGLRRLPFGLAVRANQTVSRLSNYEYGEAKIEVDFSGVGKFIDAVRINGESLCATLQLPQARLRKGANTVEVSMREVDDRNLCLVESSVLLRETSQNANETRYVFETLVEENFLAFRNLDEQKIELRDASNARIEYSMVQAEERCWLYFAGRGDFALQVSNDPKT